MCKLFKSDWQTVWAYVSSWPLPIHRAVYEIQFSKRRNKYRLILEGYRPKQNDSYPEAVKLLNQFQEDLRKQKGPEGFDFKSDPTR